MAIPQHVTWIWIPHCCDRGIAQMALDEALLEWVRSPGADGAMVITRTYQWQEPTLSLGVHQHDRDTQRAYTHYADGQKLAVVRRPTGGRSILHGRDVSFAFVTNHPALLKMSLDESYCFFTTWVRNALESLGVPLVAACTDDKRAYLRSPLCFDTQTPSDLLTPQGHKVAGSAQLRRQNGILQHGAAFLNPFDIDALQFDAALQQAIASSLNQSPPVVLNPGTTEGLSRLWQTCQRAYTQESEQIAARLSITSGSHLAPASD